MFDVLAQQRQHQVLVDRVLKVVLPIMAFLLSVICANLNWQSTLGTFVILTLPFMLLGLSV
jgi:sorbitol-specific phosphotransferase system component IIBC